VERKINEKIKKVREKRVLRENKEKKSFLRKRK
jgi:hypothetical protein